MRREGEIAIASCAYGSRGSSIDFTAGVKWADSNPILPWINVNDDLPCNHKELISPDKSSENLTVTEYVVAVVYGFKLLSRMYELDGK